MSDSSAPDQLARLMAGYWHTQAIYVAARLKIADLLAAGPRNADQLAQASGTSSPALYRLLRALASIGIFQEDEEQRFSLTAMAECLRSDLPGSLWAMAIMRGEWQYQAWGQLLHSIQTGQSAFEKIHGMPLFEFFEKNPDKGKLFDAAMTGVHGRETSAILEAYDFSGIGTIADIGGGNASVLTAILKQYPAMNGTLFDLPAVVERARPGIDAAGLGERCRILAGNFFESVPPGADAYLLRHVIHDWDDDRAAAILKNCRKELARNGKILVVEGIVPPGNEPSISKFFDLAMMVLPGGMERTEDEYRRLYESAGIQLVRIVPTRTWISVIEGKLP